MVRIFFFFTQWDGSTTFVVVDPILFFTETTKIEHGTWCGLRAMEVGELGELLPGRDGNSIQADYAGWKVAFRRACHWSGRGF
jgi:hypothetical protein